MDIEDNIVRKDWGEALPELREKLNGYMRVWSRIYVGTTTDFSTRARKHAPKGWAKMALLYNAYAPYLAAGMERELIAHIRSTKYQVARENIAPGGEGVLADNSHFIYVLVAQPRNRARRTW